MNTKKTVMSFVLFFIMVCFAASHIDAAPAKKLIIALGQEVSTTEPNIASVGGDFTVVENYGEYLVYKAPSGDLKPGLATSWKVSPDGREIEFTLRKGVKFHSGDPLTAKDVQFSFERGQAKNPLVKTRLRLMERFEVIDDYRFKIHLKTADVNLIPNRGAVMIVSKTYYDRVGEEKFVRSPVGTGPYKFVDYVPGEYLDIERFDEYWGEKPSVKEARFLFVTEATTRVSKLKAGEVDMITTCPYPAVKDLEKSPNFVVIKVPTNHPTPAILFANRNLKMPWHDKRVRLAMAHAIDCDAIIKSVYQGIPNHWAFVAPYELGYDPQLKPYPYDPKKAKQLLVEAGYPNGFDLKLYSIITGRFPFMEGAEAIAAYFEAVGIRTKVVGEEAMKNLSRHRAAKAPDAEYVGFFSTIHSGAVDPTVALDLYFASEGGFTVYHNPEIDKITAEAKATTNEKKRAELVKKAIRILHDDVASIPVCNAVVVYAMKKNIEFKPTQKHNQELLFVRDVTMK
jgi:peptide/nickel transport system substrate-binding protein